MNMLACAKLSTPIMLKIRVRPLDSMKSSKPYTIPFSSEKTISSSMVHGSAAARAGPPPTGSVLLRAFHLACGQGRRVLRIDLAVGHEPEPGVLDVVLGLVRHRREEQRLEQLVIVRPQLDLAESRLVLESL